MTSDSAAGEAHLLKFQELLRELFQFDCADLDFGIYRIMNHKRDAIEKFISEQLPARIAADLETGRLASQSQAAADLEEARQKVLENFGSDAIDADDELDGKYSGTPRGRDYLEAQAAAEPGLSPQAVETAVYNHLYSFFSRYYQDGDFVSKRRYGRNQRYAIPYNGEEVYLHWANSDQYYVKTAEHFNNYDWKAPNGVSVHFRLEAANVEQDNVKGDRRFFLPLVDKSSWDAAARAVTVRFEYRPLTVSESTRYGKQRQQDKIITTAVSEIPQRLPKVPEAVTALTGEHRRGRDDEPVSRLEHHLKQYTRRNDSDFFIHKDLRGFLSRELDFYLKNEVLNLDNLEAAGEQAADGWFQQMRLIKSVGCEIVDFLAQIEEFQKMLWEKRKFVVDTQYCFTLGSIDSAFHQEIVDNEAQWEDWKELLGIDGANRSKSFLKSQPTLPLDTRHFDAEFTDRLLASFDDLDGMTDGLLIHSENWQALSLLQEKYKGRVRCTYIDPPFNTDDSQFVFKDTYRNSTWLTLMGQRLRLGKLLCTSDGTVYLHLDHNSNFYGRFLVNSVFGEECLLNEVIWRIGWVSGYKTAAPRYVRNHETIFVCGVQPQPHFNKDRARITYKAFDKSTIAKHLDGIKKVWALDNVSPLRLKLVFKDMDDNVYKIGLKTTEGSYNVEDTWNSNEYEELHSNKIKRNAAEYTPHGSEITQKPEQLLRRVVEVSSDKGDIVLDFFCGSGTSPAVALKLGRKFIGIEMGTYFETDILWRMKQVLFGKQVGISKQTRYTGGGSFKYIRLESYEDALDGIGFDEEAGQLDLEDRIDGYLLKYMLKWETKQSETLLSAAMLTRPFDYRLRTHANGETHERTADVAETFNYLLGLNVRTRRVYDDDGKRYLVFRGETRDVPGRNVKVIWRETEGWTQEDFARDRQFVDEQGLVEEGDVVYVNGGSVIPGAKAVEPVFKARMFAGAHH